MSKMRRFAAIAAVAAMTACMTVPMMAVMPASAADPTYTITIKNTVAGHTYEAYQIFTGTLSTDGNNVLSNVNWGADIDGAQVVAALKANTTLNKVGAISGLADDASAATVAEALAGLTDKSDEAKALADVFATLIDKTPTKSSTVVDTNDTDEAVDEYQITGLASGYYFVKDKDGSLTSAHDAYTGYVLEVVADAEVTPKSAFPTVDKQVWDETADKDTNTTDANWGETADHAINESFQFKLIADVAGSAEYAYYETYKLVFTDEMSAGVTFESIEGVYVNGTKIDSGYVVDGVKAGDAGATWTVTITNLLAHDNNLADGATVEVIYNAHLNEDATVTKANGSTDNANTVYLEYSNNPNWDGSGTEELGKAPEDTVWVFTYEVDNTKYKNSVADANKLAGAGFTLYTDAEKTTPVNLILDGSVYRPATADEQAAEGYTPEMQSLADGTFNIVGLDAGTYYLAETDTPDGYNTCADITIVIDAKHSETSETTNYVYLTTDETDNVTTNSDNLANNVVNKAGSTLPGTGGIGTTLFYVVGGSLVAGAGVTLIAKKRMKKED